MSKISNMIIRLFTQYNHIEKEGNYWLNSSNYYEIEKSNEKCLYGCFSAIYTFR